MFTAFDSAPSPSTGFGAGIHSGVGMGSRIGRESPELVEGVVKANKAGVKE